MCDRLIDGISKSLNAYLHLSRLEHVVRTEKKERLSLSDVAHECAEHVRILADVRGIDVRTTIEPGARIEGYPEKVRELIVNLLSNAIKYMGDRTTRRVVVTVRRVNAYACLVIEDTGIGIPKRDLKHICSLFYRGANGLSGAAGAGIGLAMVKKIAETHGASVQITSSFGRGTRVAVRFPAV
jgi:signal transduction histidine kinase